MAALFEMAGITAIFGTPGLIFAIVMSVVEALWILSAGIALGFTRRGREEWSIAEIVAHLVDGEWAWFTRIRRMATEDRPLMETFPNADYSRPSLGESLAGYVRDRARDLEYLESLAPEQWARPGQHEFWGDIDVLWAARHLAAHDAEHLAQIARLREPPQSS